jgi:hypothetical protein
MTALEKARYLRTQKWVQDTGKAPWSWRHPKFRGTFYLLDDAYDLAVSEEKEKKTGKPAKDRL